jgi:cytoskeleton protein RodZ
MSEASESAGAQLRAAREKQGLHIAALATMLKVPAHKLEALEADQYGEFPGNTFVRALAQAACRTLKIDPVPVLERLPEQDGGTLSQLERGLNMPFREHGARRESADAPFLSRAMLALVVLLLLGAMAFLLWPAGWHLPGSGPPAEAPEPTTGTVTIPVPVPSGSVSTEPTFTPAPAIPASTVSTLPSPVASSGTAPAAPSNTGPASQALPAGLPQLAASTPAQAPSPALPPASALAQASGHSLQLTARGATWVEVVDGRAQVLIGRTLAAGEVVSLEGVLPLRVKIGNASGTELSFQGKPIDLTAVTRDNVARLELK